MSEEQHWLQVGFSILYCSLQPTVLLGLYARFDCTVVNASAVGMRIKNL